MVNCEICDKRVGSWSKVIIENIITCGNRSCMKSAINDGLTSDQRRRKQNRESGKYDKICEQCGNPYHAFRHDQKFCSNECKIESINLNVLGDWSRQIKKSENVNIDFVSHHILPKSAFPELSNDLLNGVPLPEKWHKQFHAETGGTCAANDPFRDWAGLLFKFIEEKIIESKLQLNTLDQWF